MFPVSVMILVMIVFGGIGSVWGVVVGALILQMLQSWFLEDLSQWLHALGRLINVAWLQRIELASSIELIFGLILVFMMLYRREGLIPATRRMPALSLDQQSAQVDRGGFAGVAPIQDCRGAMDQQHVDAEARNASRIVAAKASVSWAQRASKTSVQPSADKPAFGHFPGLVEDALL